MRFRAVAVAFGAVVASSFSTPTKFGAAGSADAADVLPPPPPQMTKVPEFVPVINFSEFVMAVQTFAAENPPPGRAAAEALIAKFESPSNTQQIEAQKAPQQSAISQAAAAPVKATVPMIVSHPVVTASIPAVADPTAIPPEVADPVKVITAYPEKPTQARSQSQPRRHRAEKKVAETGGRPRGERKKFRPAMGLGMTVDSAEDMPPPSSFARSRRTIYRWDGTRWFASGK